MNLDKFVEAARKLGLLGVKVTQNDELKAEWLFEPEIRRNIYSASKSFTSCAVGFAVQEGLLRLDEKLIDVFADELPEEVNEHMKKATIRDLLTMSLGQSEAGLMSAERYTMEENDWVKYSLSIPFTDEPGKKFVYSNVGPYLAGIIVQRRSGCHLVDYLMPRLFTPLGIKRPTWEMDLDGNVFGAGGLMLSLSELHKLGLFYLNRGKWNGKQLLSEEWIEESTKQNGDFPYAYLFWRGEYNSFRAAGMYEQFSIVIPEKNAVVSTVAECRDGDAMLRAIYDYVCAQL